MFESIKRKKSVLIDRLPYSLLLLIFVLLLTGCITQNEPTSPLPPESSELENDYSKLQIIRDPKNLTTLTVNPIEFENTNIEVPGVEWRNTLFIKGLTDFTIEEGINANLQSIYDALDSSSLPLYRGIYKRIPKGTLSKSQNINAFPSFNFSNLLSVVIYGDKIYEFENLTESLNPLKSLSTEYISQIETLNIDLRTGQKITIPELFADPKNAMDLINEEVSKKLFSQMSDDEPNYDFALWYAPRITSSFKGFNADQKFYLSETGIVLVIDHNNPEFEIGFYPVQITLPFQNFKGKLAFEERFQAEHKTLYLSQDPIEKQFIRHDDFNSENTLKIEENSDANSKVRTYTRVQYPDYLPDVINDHIQTIKKQQEAVFEQLNTLTITESENQPFYETTVSVYPIGPFFILKHTIYPYGIENLTPTFVLKTFTSDGVEVVFSSCFKQDYDYKTAIYRAYSMSAEQMGFEVLDQENLFKSLQFCIGTTEFEFSIPQENNFCNFNVLYKDLGSENLTIFE